MKIGSLVDAGEVMISVAEPDSRTRAAISSLKLCIWYLDVSTGSLIVCKRCREILPILDERRSSIDSLAAIIATGHREKFTEVVVLN